MPERKIPVRMCMGCNEHKAKKELIRIVKSPEDEISVDLSGKKNGRGAYICHDIDCFKKLRKSKRLARAFSLQIPEEIYDRLEEEISE